MMTKDFIREIGYQLKQQLDQEYDVKKLANWAYDLYMSRERDSLDLYRIVSRICYMEIGARFYHPKETLLKMAHLMIAEGRNPFLTEEDSQLQIPEWGSSSLIRDVNYFNLEISRCGTVLAVHASKKGIDAFLGQLGTQPQSKVISLETLSHPHRRWTSYKVVENPKVTPLEPSPHMIENRGDDISNRNYLTKACYLEVVPDSKEGIFCIGLRQDIPLITVDTQGWEKFWRILETLRDTSPWFYVTIPNKLFAPPLPFQLTFPSCGHAQDHSFTALECFRFEQEEEIFLCARLDLEAIERNKETDDSLQLYKAPPLISGNSSGLLLFAQWVRDCITSPELSCAIFNKWHRFKKHPDKQLPPWIYVSNYLHLKKVEMSFPHPLLSFETKANGAFDLYIFGNIQGLEELCSNAEIYAFLYDHDEFYPKSIRGHLSGDTTERILGGDGFYSLNGWDILGGLFYSRDYNPLNFQKETAENRIQFINNKIILFLPKETLQEEIVKKCS